MVSNGVNYDGSPVGTGKQQAEGMEDPLYQWTPVIGASGMLFYTGDAFPEWKGSLLNGGLVAKDVVRLELDGSASNTRSACSVALASASGRSYKATRAICIC